MRGRYAACAERLTALDFNIPKSDQFCINRRGQRLHLRTVVPSTTSHRAILFFFHGYGAHINGPAIQELSAGLAQEGYVVVLLDSHGHGYSDGDRVLIMDFRDLVDDCMQVMEIILRGREDDGEMCFLGLDPCVRKSLMHMPFFLLGQSMGGALALLCALRLKGEKSMSGMTRNFVGVMTNCPAIVGNPPPKWVVMLLKHCLVPLLPAMQLPTFLEKVSVPDMIWTDEYQAQLAELDQVGLPGGLCWPGTMRIGTGAQLLDMLAYLQPRLRNIDFPFLVLHDPEDGIVKFEGTEMLQREAQTPHHVLRGREVKEMPAYKHDLLANAPEQVLSAYLDWANARLSVRGKEICQS